MLLWWPIHHAGTYWATYSASCHVMAVHGFAASALAVASGLTVPAAGPAFNLWDVADLQHCFSLAGL